MELEEELYNKDIIFAYSGGISYNILSTVSAAVKEDLSKKDANTKELYNVYYIFVELLQNIMNYSAKRKIESNIGSGTCFVTYNKTTNKFSVCAGNMIDSNDAQKIKDKIDKINSLNSEELKAYHKDVRRSGDDTHDKGAGLGFIEIARKSSTKLKYEIREINDHTSYFEIHVNI
jgi:hypothetical protein